MKNKVILIAGGSASGKTSFAMGIAKELKKSGNSVCVITCDNYFDAKNKLKQSNSPYINWDHPSATLFDEIYGDIKKLLSNKTVKRNVFSYDTSDYSKDEFVTLVPSDYIIVEGLYTLYNDKILDLSDHKFYIQSDSDTRLIRRIKRDKEVRYKDFNENAFMLNWETNIKPMHFKYNEPQTKIADIIFPNYWGEDKTMSSKIEFLSKLLISEDNILI